MSTSRPRILVVDDESDALIFVSSLLESAGYQVETCTNALEALAAVARRHPDVVISDVRMPGIEGLELLAKIKHMAPSTRVILHSAYGTCEQYLEALEKGGDDLLLKPVKNDELLRTVERVLESAKSSGGR